MTDENNYKLRDHPEFPLDIDVPFAKVLRPELICSACNCVTPAGLKDGNDHVYCLKCAEVLTDCTNQFTCCICQWSGPKSSLGKILKEWAVLEKEPSACPNRNKTCRFKGKLRDVLNHYKTCNLTKKAKCTLCGSVEDIKTIADHMWNDCPMRHLECNFCGQDVVARDKLRHEVNCDQRPGTCEHCGKQFRTYEELEQKHKVVCQLVPVDCSFKQLGCGYKAARREMEIHEANSRHNGHNDLLVRKLCRLEKENEDRKHAFHEMLETVKGTYEDKIQHMQRNMAELQESANAERTLRTKLEELMLALEKELQALRMKQNDDNGQLEYRLTETEDTVERLNRELHLDPMTPGFEYVWKLQPYFALKAAAMASTEEISSGALYINTPGYRVEFTVGFTRPSSMTSSQHLSFKCRIRSGEYDDMLPWPFQNKIILVLVNQQDERSRRCFELDTATAEHAADCFKKPVSDQRNPKFGYSQVIPVPLLENEKKGFLFQNCVVLKIVAPPLY